jgi:Ca2+-transporting ATPase
MLLTRIIGVVGAVGLIVFGLSLLRGMELTEALRFVIAVSVSAVPESLPVAISVILVLGMRRMAARKALVRNMNAIETIGVITTIATDKTGTLTKNKLTVQSTWQPSITKTDFLHLITKAANHSRGKLHDPLDIALLDFSTKEKIASPAHPPLKSFPFDLSTAMSGNLWHHGSSYELVIKGAPEHVINRSDMTENEREEANATLHRMTGEGYRVIAVAHSSLPRKLDNLHELGRADSLVFDGFVAVADILRPEAKRAVTAALDAGVSVRMITGDHFETAYHIGKQLGMVTHREEVFDSRKLSVMSDRELTKIIPSIKVFSRVIPEHKYRILAILKKKHITAMTGDGVNDVPALANAHVGIAMGGGAQIAKDAGDIILMDNNFKGIVDAMHEGRTIFANIRRMLFYLLATNTGEVLVMIGALVIGLPVPLIPVQILWINLVTDTSMVIPLGLEKGEKANMKQKPLPPTTPILGKFMINRMLLLAVTMASLTLGLYAYYSGRYGHDYGSTVAFCSLVVMQWASALCARSDDEPLVRRLRIMNGPFYIGLAAAVTLQILAVFGPLGHLLHISPVAIGDLYVTGLIAFFTPLTLMELHKWWGRQRTAVRRRATSGLAKPSADMLY